MAGDLTAAVAALCHDARNECNGLALDAQIALGLDQTPPGERAVHQRVLAAVRRLSAVVGLLADAEGLLADTLELDLAPRDAARVSRDVRAIVEHEFGVDLPPTGDAATAPPPLLLDAVRFGNALRLLLHEQARANSPGETEVTVEYGPDGLSIVVDRPTSDRDRATATQPGGTRIALRLAEDVLARHGAAVAQCCEGERTTFRIDVPAGGAGPVADA